MTTDNVLISVKDLKKKFDGMENHALNGVSIDIHNGEVVFVVGPSGSGKSTFLRCLNLLEEPTEGTIHFDGVDITDPKTDINMHRQKMGMVFQQFNLFPHMTVMKNLTLAPMKLQGKTKEEAEKTAMELLERVGLANRADAYPNQLSGGQKQRIAIARAMANDPAIILADEPTGALDSKTGRLVMDIFHKLHKEQGKTIVLITHNPELAEETDRIITLSDGNIVSDVLKNKPEEAKEAAE